jgi:hypothetical protein
MSDSGKQPRGRDGPAGGAFAIADHPDWIHHYGLAGAYVLLPVAPERLAVALRGLAALGFVGCNVTIPHKVAAMQLVDRVDAFARRIGAINTIVVERDGTLSGYNNDGFGYVQSLCDAKPDWRADAGPIVVLGAGGAARAVVATLADADAREIRLLNRTPQRALDIAQAVGAVVKVRREQRTTRRRTPRCSSTRRARAWQASRRSTSRLPPCRNTPSSPTSSTSRWKRRCLPRRAPAATPRSTALACC